MIACINNQLKTERDSGKRKQVNYSGLKNGIRSWMIQRNLFTNGIPGARSI